MSHTTKQALDFFNQGYSCSQSVLATFAPGLGLPIETAFKIAAPFGGGIARTGDLCGAVTGAIMVLGLKYGHTTPTEPNSKELTYQIVQEFLKQFKARHDTLLCSELKNANNCSKLVEDAADILTHCLYRAK
ncbi:MAG: C_GCAxxG_C_C family protein [Anaerolineales bacterium]|nr:C_GCAxxG_C_C family protein [Anaerolineales bacterium]